MRHFQRSTFETPRFGARDEKCSFSATNEPIFDRLDIFSDATDVKITLVLLFRVHLHPIIDSEGGYFFKFQDAFFLTKQQESCPSFAGELTCRDDLCVTVLGHASRSHGAHATGACTHYPGARQRVLFFPVAGKLRPLFSTRYK